MTMLGEMKYSGTDAYTGTMTMDASGQKMTMASTPSERENVR